jgi:hypothetical protein
VYAEDDESMKLPTIGERISIPLLGAALAPGVGLTVLTYGNGYTLATATVVGAATAAVGLWAVITEP